jgi:hypothetical protein
LRDSKKSSSVSCHALYRFHSSAIIYRAFANPPRSLWVDLTENRPVGMFERSSKEATCDW